MTNDTTLHFENVPNPWRALTNSRMSNFIVFSWAMHVSPTGGGRVSRLYITFNEAKQLTVERDAILSQEGRLESISDLSENLARRCSLRPSEAPVCAAYIYDSLVQLEERSWADKVVPGGTAYALSQAF